VNRVAGGHKNTHQAQMLFTIDSYDFKISRTGCNVYTIVTNEEFFLARNKIKTKSDQLDWVRKEVLSFF